MVQGAVLDGFLFVWCPLCQNGFGASEVGTSQCEVADAVLGATVVVVANDRGTCDFVFAF